MELETTNKLFLELSQFVTAKTERELALEDLLTSVRNIARREGVDTAWWRLDAAVARHGIGDITAKTFKTLPSDK